MKTSNTVRFDVFASLLATGALLSGLSLPVHAADAPAEAVARKVSLTDLNLSTVAGQTAARERLHHMARALCARVEEDLDPSRQSNYVKCVEATTARTLPHLDAMIHDASAFRTAAMGHPQP